MKKRYESRQRGINILVPRDGKYIDIDFKDCIVDGNVWGCAYETEDEYIQREMEAHTYFNSQLKPNFYLCNAELYVVKEEDAVEDQAVEVMQEVASVDIQEQTHEVVQEPAKEVVEKKRGRKKK